MCVCAQSLRAPGSRTAFQDLEIETQHRQHAPRCPATLTSPPTSILVAQHSTSMRQHPHSAFNTHPWQHSSRRRSESADVAALQLPGVNSRARQRTRMPSPLQPSGSFDSGADAICLMCMSLPPESISAPPHCSTPKRMLLSGPPLDMVTHARPPATRFRFTLPD